MQIKWKRLFITVISVVLLVGSSFAVTHYGKEPVPPFDLESVRSRQELIKKNLKLLADVAINNLKPRKVLWDMNMKLVKRLEQFNKNPELQQKLLKEMYDLYHETKQAMIEDGMRSYPYSAHWYPTMVDYYRHEVPREI